MHRACIASIAIAIVPVTASAQEHGARRWMESVTTSLRSMDEALRSGAIAEALRAADHAMYANLQMRRDSAARALLARLPDFAARFHPEAVTGAVPGSAGVFALAAMPARYALERDAWTEAIVLRATSTRFPYAEAMTYFARALGAARIGAPDDAATPIDSLKAIHARLVAAGEAYWAEQVAIQRLSASAWRALAAGRADSAIAMMGDAARREEATEKAAVSPGPLAPARELLADMLYELGAYAQALAEYRTSLRRDPNRFRSLRGATRAAAWSGDRDAESDFRRQLTQLTSP